MEQIDQKLHAESQRAIQAIRAAAGPNSRIVFVAGNFNIVHPGHLRLLRFARECGDFLAVGVQNDNASTVISQELRLEGLSAIATVDYPFLLNDAPEDFIAALQPAVVVKGKEHEKGTNPELEAVKAYGGKLRFGSGDLTFSSLDLLKREIQEFNISTIVIPKDFPVRHGFDMDSLVNILERIRNLRVCVLGDTIVDEYITCEALGMSQEDPTVVVTPVVTDRFIGGAAIVAAHARSLGARVNFFSVLGRDETADYLREQLDVLGIQQHLYEDDTRPTTLKQRYRAKNKTLLRVSHLRQHELSEELGERILIDFIEAASAGMDLVVFSDFNYGCLPQAVVDRIVAYCTENGIAMAADSQSSSQVGDVSRFRNQVLLTPTEREARLAVGDFSSGLVTVAEKLRKKCDAKNIFMTLGAEGIMIHAGSPLENAWATDRLPAFNTIPKDPSGAGDSFLTCASMALAVGGEIWQAAYLGSLAAACQVGRLGNVPLKPEEILAEIRI